MLNCHPTQVKPAYSYHFWKVKLSELVNWLFFYTFTARNIIHGMKTFYTTLLLAACIFLGSQCHPESGEKTPSSSADSLYTLTYIQSIRISEPERALLLLDTAIMKNRISEFKADYMRYCIYDQQGMFHIAENYLQKVMNSDSMKTASPQTEIQIKNAFVDLNTRFSNYPQAMQVATELCEKARLAGNKRLESEMLHLIGKIYRNQGVDEEADQYTMQAIALLENSSDIRELAYLSFIYGQQMTDCLNKNELEKAIETGEKRKKLIDRMSGMPGPPEGYCDEQYGYLYSKLAAIYEENKQPEKAAAAFDKFRSTRFSKTEVGHRDAIPYLICSKQFKEAAETIPDEQIFGNDTINGDFINNLDYRSEIAAGNGNYRAALEYRKRRDAIKDSINARNKQNAALELATIYATNRKDLLIKEQDAQIDRQRIILIATLGALLFAGLTIYLIGRHLRITRQKNRVLAKQIDEGVVYREKLHKANDEIEELKQLYAATLQTGTSEQEQEAEQKAGNASDSRTALLNQKLFNELERVMEEKKLYLDPEISRDALLRQVHISKNVFAQLIQTFAGTNFNGYINNKRLDHSISLLKDYNSYTIEAVAADSGFNNVRSFYRTFKNKYGMTPSEYRDTFTLDQ